MKTKLIAALSAGLLTAAAVSGCNETETSGSSPSSAADSSLAVSSSAAEPSQAESSSAPETESLSEEESEITYPEPEPQLVIDPLDELTAELPDEKPENTEVWLLSSSAPLREADGQPMPSERLFDRKYGGRIVTDTVPEDELFSRLTAMVLSNEAPDLVPTDSMQLFPRGAADRLFMPLDVVIGTDDELWTSTEERSAAFIYRGRRYAAVFETVPEYVCIYNKDTVRENDLEDPVRLYDQGLWTHGWFETLCRRFAEGGSGRTAVDGENYAAALSESCGIPLLTMRGGQVISNLEDSTLAQTQDWMYSLTEQGLCAEVPQWDIAAGRSLFCPEKLSLLEESRENTEKFGRPAENVMFLPMPKDEKACISAKPRGFLFPAGSKNPKGAAAFLRCLNAAAEADSEASERRLMEVCGWSEDMIVMRRECFRLAEESSVIDFSRGMPQDTYNNLLKGVTGRSMLGGGHAVSWSDTVEELRRQLDFAVMTANDTEPTGP